MASSAAAVSISSPSRMRLLRSVSAHVPVGKDQHAKATRQMCASSYFAVCLTSPAPICIHPYIVFD